MKRSRGVLVATVAVAAVAVLGCVPNPSPPSDPTTTTEAPTTTTSTTTTTTSTTLPNAAPEVAITSPSGEVSVNEIDVIELAASASDPEDGDLGDSVSWRLLADAPGATPVDLGVGATTSAGPLAPGSYTITASVEDSGGLTATDQIHATVAECTTTLVLTPGSGDKDKGPLHISAAQSADSCGRPLLFIWDCHLDMHLPPGAPPPPPRQGGRCVDFEAAAASGDLTDYTFDLAVYDLLSIRLEVCPPQVPGQGWMCEVQINHYYGIEPFF